MKKRFTAFLVIVFLLISVIPFTNISARGQVFTWYYDQLNETEKIIYNAYVQAAGGEGAVLLPFFDGLNFKFESTFVLNGENDVQRFYSENAGYIETTGKIKAMLDNAMAAASLDHPEFYWTSTDSSATIHYTSTYEKGDKKIEITKISLTTKTYSNAKEILDVVDQRLAFINAQGTPAEKVKAIHDYLCSHVIYSEGNNAHDLYGAMFDGKAVCQGYAEAFKAACDYYGIPAICVEGSGINSSGATESHMWNFVQLDGAWYAVDATWDDQDTGIYRDYFLVGSETIAHNFDDKTFGETHINTRNASGCAATDYFKFPVLSKSAYYTEPTAESTPEPTVAPSSKQPVATPVIGELVTKGPDSLPNITATPDPGAAEATPTAAVTDGTDSTDDTVSPDADSTDAPVDPDIDLSADDNLLPDKFYIWIILGFIALVAVSTILSLIAKKRK